MATTLVTVLAAALLTVAAACWRSLLCERPAVVGWREGGPPFVYTVLWCAALAGMAGTTVAWAVVVCLLWQKWC